MRLIHKKRRISEIKALKYKTVQEAFRRYKTILIVDVEGMDANTVKKIKYISAILSGGQVRFLASKQSIARRALRDLGEREFEALMPYLTGQRLFILSDMNPFSLYALISAIRVPSYARPGMVIDKDIVIPAGDTGISPGPILSVFGRLRIPTRVQGGTIWIAKDTKVAKPGDTVSPELASLLQRLGITPIERGVKVLAAYYEGTIIPAESLRLDVDAYKTMVQDANRAALALGLEAAVPLPEIMPYLIPLAYSRALAVAAEACVITDETAQRVILNAIRRAYALVLALGDRAKEIGAELQTPVIPVSEQPQPVSQQPEAKAEAEEEEEEKKEISEEDLSAGLSSLFG